MALKVKAVAPAVRPTTPAATMVVATTRDLATSNYRPSRSSSIKGSI